MHGVIPLHREQLRGQLRFQPECRMSEQPNSTDIPATAEWYYQLLGLATGPVTHERMQTLVQNGHLVAATLVGHSSDGPWQRLGESNFSQLIPQKTETEKKKGVRISSRSFRAKRRPKPSEQNVDHTEVAVDGIEVETGPIELDLSATLRAAAVAPATTPKTPTPQEVPASPEQPSVSADTSELDEVEREEPLPVVETPAEIDLPPVLPAAPAPDTKAKSRSGSPTTIANLPSAFGENRSRYAMIALGVVGTLGLLLLLPSLFGGPDGERAYAVFRRVSSDFEVNSKTLDDTEWALFIRDSREKVHEVLTPLRDEVTSENPKEQSLMWAGDRLVIMLKGSRKLPNGLKRQFESYMAEYTDEPVPEPPPKKGSNVESEPVESEIRDPVFDP